MKGLEKLVLQKFTEAFMKVYISTFLFSMEDLVYVLLLDISHTRHTTTTKNYKIKDNQTRCYS